MKDYLIRINYKFAKNFIDKCSELRASADLLSVDVGVEAGWCYSVTATRPQLILLKLTVPFIHCEHPKGKA